MKFKVDDYPPFKAGAGEHSYEDMGGIGIGIWEWKHNGTHYYEITSYIDGDIHIKNAMTQLPDLTKDRNRNQVAKALSSYFDLTRERSREIIDDLHQRMCYKPKQDFNISPELDPEEIKNIMDVAKDPYILAHIKQLLDLNIVGEDVNKLVCWINAAAANQMPMWIYLSGESRGGKDTIMDGVSLLLPSEKVIHAFRFSTHALEYLDEEGTGMTDLDGKIIILPEGEFSKEAMEVIRGMYGKKGQVYPIHLVKDQQRNTIYLKGCPVIITGGVTPIFEDQTMNRFQIHTIDGTVEQTENIHLIQKTMAAYPFTKTTEHEKNIQEIVRSFKPVEVVIPYATLLDFPKELIRFRDDFKRFLYLIKNIAYVHQHSRKQYEVDGVTYITATFGDLYLATHFVVAQFSSQIYNLDEAVYGFYLKLSETYGEQTFYVSDAHDSTGKAPQTIRNYMNLLEERGLVEVTKENKKNVYTLLIIEKKFKNVTLYNLVRCLLEYTEKEHNTYLESCNLNNRRFPGVYNAKFGLVPVTVPVEYEEVVSNIYDPFKYIYLENLKLFGAIESGGGISSVEGVEVDYVTWLDKVIEKAGVPINGGDIPLEKKASKKKPQKESSVNEKSLPPASSGDLKELFPDDT